MSINLKKEQNVNTNNQVKESATSKYQAKDDNASNGHYSDIDSFTITNVEPAPKQLPDSKGTTIIMAGIIVVAVIIFAAIVFKSLRPVLFPFKYENTASELFLSGNAVNGSELAIESNKIYYIKDINSYYENEEGETTDISYDVALFRTDINITEEEEIYRFNDDVSHASLQIVDGKAYVLQRLFPDFDSEEHEKCRLDVIDLSSGEIVHTINPNIEDVESFIVTDGHIFVKWDDWRGEEAIECLGSIDDSDGSVKRLYETTGHFYYTLDTELVYISEIDWDYDNEEDTGNRILLSIDYYGNDKNVIVNEEISGDEYRDGLFMSSMGLIQLRETYLEDDDKQIVDVVSSSLDEGADYIINSWTNNSYGGIGAKNIYGDYLYFQETRDDGKSVIKRLKLADGNIQKVINVPNVGYMDGEYVEILLFNEYIVLNMRQLEFEESGLVIDKNRIFLYDLYGNQISEL